MVRTNVSNGKLVGLMCGRTNWSGIKWWKHQVQCVQVWNEAKVQFNSYFNFMNGFLVEQCSLPTVVMWIVREHNASKCEGRILINRLGQVRLYISRHRRRIGGYLGYIPIRQSMGNPMCLHPTRNTCICFELPRKMWRDKARRNHIFRFRKWRILHKEGRCHPRLNWAKMGKI